MSVKEDSVENLLGACAPACYDWCLSIFVRPYLVLFLLLKAIKVYPRFITCHYFLQSPFITVFITVQQVLGRFYPFASHLEVLSVRFYQRFTLSLVVIQYHLFFALENPQYDEHYIQR